MIESIQNKKLISSDIFDTLIFRVVKKPEDIFRIVQARFEETYNEYLPHDYVYIRMFAEKEARDQDESKEIQFDDIFKYIPYDAQTVERLKLLEFEIEKESLIVNDEVYRFLKESHEKGLLVILTSDMYFSKKQLEEILASIGCDLHIFDNIYVSSEFKASKSNSKLYKVLFVNYENIKPEEMLHIGDNYYSDYVMAKELNIESYHYTPILENIDSVYNLEEGWNGISLDFIRSLRKVSRNQDVALDNDEKRTFNIGSQLFGPVYSVFVDWIIDYARKHKIQKLCPLMREGELFAQLIQTKIASENLKLEVVPIYVSRKATYLPSLEKFDEEEIENLFKKQNLHLEDLFQLILLPLENTIFQPYKNLPIRDLYGVKVDGSNLKELLRNFLNTTEVRKAVNEHIIEQKLYFKDYLSQAMGNESFITIDLAGNGTIQTQIDDTLENKEQSHHLMMLGRVNTLKKIIKGYNFIAWLGYDDLHNEKIKNFFRSPEIIEAVTNVYAPGTSHYSIKNGQITLVQTSTVYPAEQKRHHQLIWSGIKEFQNNWIRWDTTYKLTNRIIREKEAFIGIFSRLINYPSKFEAKLLGSFIQDDQFSYSRTGPIIDEKDFVLLEKMGIEDFLRLRYESYAYSQVYWPQGVVAVKNENYFEMEYYKHKLLDNDYIKIHLLIQKIAKENYKKICIYGAGEIGKKIVSLAKYYHLPITCFADKNYLKFKGTMEGIPVKSIDQIDEDIDLIIIGSQAFFQEIEDQLIHFYKGKKQPVIVGI